MTTHILALDTATPACSVALLKDNGECVQEFALTAQRHSNVILNFVDLVLADSGITLNEVDAIAFGAGPGSFMGVRTAVGIAQGLAYASDIPVIPISTLRALAQSAFKKTKERCVIAGWDARLQSIYWGAYRMDDHNIAQSIVADALEEHPDQMAWPDTLLEPNTLAAGNAWVVYRDQISKSFQEKIGSVLEFCYPEASSVADIALVDYQKGQYQPPEVATPMYLRHHVAQLPRSP